jgi:hypothetical protein
MRETGGADRSVHMSSATLLKFPETTPPVEIPTVAEIDRILALRTGSFAIF